jgi:hypothetical protein
MTHPLTHFKSRNCNTDNLYFIQSENFKSELSICNEPDAQEKIIIITTLVCRAYHN